MSTFDYARKRFERALCILRGDPDALGGWPDQPKHRLWLAVLEVFPCTRSHFPRERDYHAFALLLGELRDRSRSRNLFEASSVLSEHECRNFIVALTAIAESTVRQFALVPKSPREADGSNGSRGHG